MARISDARLAEIRKENQEKRARAEAAAQNPRKLDVSAAAIALRNEVAAEVLSFYEFLTKLHLPAEAIKRPPTDGWSFINAERFGFMGKTDAVIDLLKHIPYISQDEEAGYQIYTNCTGWDYTGVKVNQGPINSQDGEALDPMDAADIGNEEAWQGLKDRKNIATLAKGHEARDWCIVFDTSNGKMAMVCDVEDVADDRCIEYENAKALFDHLKKNFRDLTALPIRSTKVIFSGATSLSQEEVAYLKEIYREHGWPDSDFRRIECLHKLEAFDQRKRSTSLR